VAGKLQEYGHTMISSEPLENKSDIQVLHSNIKDQMSGCRNIEIISNMLFEMFGREILNAIPKLHTRITNNCIMGLLKTFDVVEYTNCSMAHVVNIKNRSKLERYRVYFPGSLNDAMEIQSKWVSWKNLLYIETWVLIHSTLNHSEFAELDYRLFKHFRELKYIPCSFKDRIWSQYRGKGVKLMLLSDMELFEPTSLDSQPPPLPTYLIDGEYIREIKSILDRENNKPESKVRGRPRGRKRGFTRGGDRRRFNG
jgi:hypothetical protein